MAAEDSINPPVASADTSHVISPDVEKRLRSREEVVGVSPTRGRPRVRAWLYRELLVPTDLIAPILIQPEQRPGTDYKHLPTAVPLSGIAQLAGDLWALGIPAVKLFAYVEEKSPDARMAVLPQNPISAAVRAIRAAVPDMVIATEVCGCAWTDHGECVLLDTDRRTEYQATLDLMARMSVVHAHAGADIVGPAAVLDGSVRAIREALDSAGFPEVAITPSIIYDSTLFGIYKSAMGTDPGRGHRRGFQIDPCHLGQALDQAARWLTEGADSLLIQPAMTSVDVLCRLRQTTNVPITAFSVSGEDWLFSNAPDATYLEYTRALRRAGADLVMTYGAARLARALNGTVSV